MDEDQIMEFVAKTNLQIRDLRAFIERSERELNDHGVDLNMLRELVGYPGRPAAFEEARRQVQMECDEIVRIHAANSIPPPVQRTRSKKSRSLI